MRCTATMRLQLALGPIVAIVAVCGCTITPKIIPINHLQDGVDFDEKTLAGGSVAQWRADPARLADDIGRAFRDIHWGTLYIREKSGQAAPPLTVRAAALLDDGRRALVAAWPIDHEQVRVAVRVGEFGQAREEQRLVNALANRLGGKPKRQYRGHFELP